MDFEQNEHFMPRWLLISALCLLGGCKNTLETGYKPAALDASESQRRAFYAPAFSPEARAAAEDPAGGKDFKRESHRY